MIDAIEKEIYIDGPIGEDLKSSLSHGICVSNLAYFVGKEMRLPENYCHKLSIEGLVHDIGKLKLSSYLYGRNENNLQIDEMRYVRMHSKIGYEVLKNSSYSEDIAMAVLSHHENYDGSGYPNNLKGDEIPLDARILRVCDVFAALVSNRPYRKAFDVDTAIELMIDEIKNFDMYIFLMFLRVVNSEKIDEILGIVEDRQEEDKNVRVNARLKENS